MFIHVNIVISNMGYLEHSSTACPDRFFYTNDLKTPDTSNTVISNTPLMYLHFESLLGHYLNKFYKIRVYLNGQNGKRAIPWVRSF